MSQPEKQQIEVEDGNLSTAEADNDSDDYDFVRLDQTTSNNCNAGVLHQQRQNGIGTIWNPLGPAISVDINELKLKMAALEAKNELLEGRLEKVELKAQIHELQEEALGHKLKEAEAKAEMANNQLKSTIQAMQQEMANFELLAKEFKAKNNAKDHLPIHIGSKWPFECHLCENTFIRVDTLQTHIRQMHKHANSSLKSESGSEEYNPLDETTTMATIRARLQELVNLDGRESAGSSLGYGINSHQPFSNDENNNSAVSPGKAIALTGEMSTFYCEWQDCQNEFPSEEAFVMHINEVHVRAEQSPHFYCRWESCTRKEPFNAQYMLAQHVRKHCGEKPYICDHVNEDGIQCPNKYARLENLKTHQRTHQGDRPYKCGYCNKMFTNASDCSKHQLRIHSSAKDFGCPVYKCAKQYTDPSSLRKHVFHEHGESVWFLAKANKEAKKATDYGLIGIRPDGTPFVLYSAAEVSSNDEDADGDVQVQMPKHDQAAVEEKLLKCQQSFVNDLTISK